METHDARGAEARRVPALLVAYDGTPSARAALRLARRIVDVAPRGAELHVLRVLPSGDAGDDSVAESAASEDRYAPRVEIRTGAPGPTIVAAARSVDVLLLGAGRRTASAIAVAALGSVCRFCIANSPAPVIAVPADAESAAESLFWVPPQPGPPWQRVVVGLSPFVAVLPTPLLSFAAATACATSAAVELRTVLPADADPPVRVAADALLHDAHLALREAGIDPLLSVVEQRSSLAAGLCAELTPHDLLVVGATHAHPLVRLLRGDLVDDCLRVSPAPVAVVPEPVGFGLPWLEPIPVHRTHR